MYYYYVLQKSFDILVLHDEDTQQVPPQNLLEIVAASVEVVRILVILARELVDLHDSTQCKTQQTYMCKRCSALSPALHCLIPSSRVSLVTCVKRFALRLVV